MGVTVRIKRVLHVFANLNLGGAESRIMDVYRHIDRGVCQFDFLIFTDEKCHFEDEVRVMGGKIYRVTHPAANLYEHIKEVSQLLKNNEFCAIHSHTSYFSGLIVFLGWYFRIEHRICHARNQAIGKVTLKSRVFFWIGKVLCNVFSTSRLAISRESGCFLFGRNAKFDVVSNSFEYDRVKYHSEGILGTPEEVINLVMVARLSLVKNHVFAIKLARKVNQSRGRKMKLHLIGSGIEEQKLLQMVKALKMEDDVMFWGKRRDVHELLCEFDGLLLPSYSEGLGVAALEGQAAGLPCLVSEGVPEDVDIGLGLVQRLPLELSLWAEAAVKLTRDQKLSKKIIDDRFSTLGYNVEQTARIYLNKYGVSR